MIFAPDAITLIRERRKTQTRRPVKQLRPGKLEPACRYHVGRLYKAQPGRGKKGQLEITILQVRQEPVGQITPQDARREGFRFTAEFRARWEQLHGTWNPDQPVWVITFAAGDLTDRFDQPRLLAATPGRVEYETTPTRRPGAKGRWQIAPDGEEHQDYTAQPRLAMLDAGEAIPTNVPKPYPPAPAKHDQIRQRTLRAETPLVDQIRQIEQRAHTGDQEAQRALFVINQRIEKANRRQPRKQAA